MSPDVHNCPVCGGNLDKAVYYSAKIADVSKSKNVEALKTTTTTTTTYTDISQKTGCICVPCGVKKYKTSRKRGSTLLISGLCLFIVIFVLSITFSSFFSRTWELGFLGQLIEVALPLITIASILAFLIGLVLTIRSKKHKGFIKPLKGYSLGDTLSYLFVINVDKTQIKNGYVVLSTEFYKQLSKPRM